MKTNIKELQEYIKKRGVFSEEFTDGFHYGQWLGLVMAIGKEPEEVIRIINSLYFE